MAIRSVRSTLFPFLISEKTVFDSEVYHHRGTLGRNDDEDMDISASGAAIITLRVMFVPAYAHHASTDYPAGAHDKWFYRSSWMG
jgi:hypothetical protein